MKKELSSKYICINTFVFAEQFFLYVVYALMQLQRTALFRLSSPVQNQRFPAAGSMPLSSWSYRRIYRLFHTQDRFLYASSRSGSQPYGLPALLLPAPAQHAPSHAPGLLRQPVPARYVTVSYKKLPRRSSQVWHLPSSAIFCALSAPSRPSACSSCEGSAY